MALACQKDSYLKQLTTTVKSCEPHKTKLLVNGKKENINGFEIILEDTVLFPEGGGQPDDRGTINDVDVLSVIRRGVEAVHFTRSPIDPGTEVHVQLDWRRRFDHMQQHSGQHLITAIADQTFGYPTTSWNLGEKVSSIELDTPAVTVKQRQELESLVNEKIRSSVAMYPLLYQGKDDPALAEVRTRGLPDDHEGPVRVVTIEGIESNMCCGTHVSNLGHLQAIKLLACEKGKKGKTNLIFVAGDRLLNYLGQCYENEKALTNLLRGAPEQHAELVDKLLKNSKQANKTALTLLREMAVMEAEKFKQRENKDGLFVLHRKEGDNEFMNIVVNEINDDKVLKFLTVGDEKAQGLFLLAGSDDVLKDLGPKVAGILDGKGAGKNGRFQGKANKMVNRQQAETMIREFIKEHEQ
ncbi:alanyl-tRNA editing protein Aarsd1-B-like [Lineus longissimus]|uniref:alanyl-tRNA editing protein Aarsd1-B-like n=1 Tax=Lineus longissimus TaxID=88925 RepID=UPI002B4EEA60